jgi:hypothetical protein
MSLSPADRIEVGDILNRYFAACRMADNEATLLDLFTDDAILDGPRGYREGTGGVIEFAAQERGTSTGKAPKTTKVGRMIMSNPVVEGDGDNATVTCGWISISHDPHDPSVAASFRTGSHDCTCVKVDGRWKIRERIVRIDGLPQFKDTPEFNSSAKWVRVDDQWVLQEE